MFPQNYFNFVILCYAFYKRELLKLPRDILNQMLLMDQLVISFFQSDDT